MWHRLSFLLPIILTASSIKVPVDNVDHNEDRVTVVQEDGQSTPVYYIKEDANVDSYLVPPDPHKPDDAFADVLATPATYLIPPTKEQRLDFYIPAEPSAQSDWLPILQAQPQNHRNARLQRPLLETIPIFLNEGTHQIDGGQFTLPIPIPSTQLVPPSVDAVNEFFQAEQNQQIHVPNYNFPIYEDKRNGPTVNPQLESAEPTLALHLIPPKPQQSLKLPTKLYPKKYANDFKPVPIPLNLFSEEKEPQAPKANPAKYFKPQPSTEVEEQFTPTVDKNLYHYKKAENKRKLKGDDESLKQHQDNADAETYGEPTSTEQETSETNFRYPGRNVYPAPLRQAPPQVPPRDASSAAAPGSDGRTEFRMHGMKGPHSYQFGYDTGKGKNRQFRYEERDNEGLVHGHYGYMDKLGKLRVVNYSAHPKYGFRAEEPVESNAQAAKVK